MNVPPGGGYRKSEGTTGLTLAVFDAELMLFSHRKSEIYDG